MYAVKLLSDITEPLSLKIFPQLFFSSSNLTYPLGYLEIAPEAFLAAVEFLLKPPYPLV